MKIVNWRLMAALTFLTISAYLITVNAQTPARTSSRTGPADSEEVVAKRYGLGLISNDFSPLWTYGAEYNDEVRRATKDLPTSMWQDTIGSIRRRWIDRINEHRARDASWGGGTIEADFCWVLFRPTAVAKVIEARGEKVFFRVSYPTEEKAPLTYGGTRRLRSVTVLLTVNRQPAGFVVSQSCGMVQKDFYPIAALDKSVALQLARKTLGDPPRITPSVRFILWRAWNIGAEPHGITGPSPATAQNNRKMVEDVVGLFRKYDAEIDARIENGYYQNYGLRVSDAWGKYRNQSLGDGAYILADSVNIEVVDLERQDADKTSATIQLTYSGCSPACQLVKELRALGKNSKFVWQSLMEQTGSDNYLDDDWPTEQSLKINFVYDYADGWHVRKS